MATQISSLITAQSKSIYVIDAVMGAFKLKASEILQENGSFSIKAQTKRYKWAKDVIEGNELTAPTAARELMNSLGIDYFHNNYTESDIKNSLDGLSPNGMDMWNYLAGVNSSEL